MSQTYSIKRHALDALLEQDADCWIRLRGDSMLPALPSNSEIKIEPVRPGALRVGDLVVFQSDDGAHLICHRVLAIETAGPCPHVLEKGDGSWRVSRLPVELIAGRVLAVRRDGQEVSLRTPVIRYLGFFIALAGRVAAPAANQLRANQESGTAPNTFGVGSALLRLGNRISRLPAHVLRRATAG